MKVGEKRKSCATLTTKLCTALGETTETCTMVRTQTKSFPPEQCDQMLQHYAEILAELQQREAANKPLTPETAARLAAGPAASFGPADAKVTIVEFSDFECPFCSRAASVAHQIK